VKIAAVCFTAVMATLPGGAGPAFAQPSGAATPDIAKQVLNRRCPELKMPDATERNVLFLDVRSSGSNSFQGSVAESMGRIEDLRGNS
jgi:hypothetical protein